MKTIKLGDLCYPCESQVSEDPDTLIDYVDISSVDNQNKQITGYQTIKFGEAPSRARKYLNKGNILVSTVRPNLNAVALFEESTPNISVASTGFCVLNCKPSTDKGFLFHYCKSKSFINAMVSQATGASYPAVSDKIVRAAMVPAYTYEEQCRIRTVLDLVSSIIVKQKKELEQLDCLIKARFVEMFGNVELGNSTYQTRKLGDVAYVGSSHRVFTTEFVENGIPFYRGTEIGELANGKQPSEPFYISHEHYNKLVSDGSKPKKGDLLLPSICNKGQVWMVDTDDPFYYKDGRVLCISADRSIYDTKYLQYFMKVKTEIEYPKMGSGSTFAEFKIFLLKDFDVLTPPMNIQKRFADFVQQIDKSKFAVQKSLDETHLLFDKLMQEYFG